MNVLVTVIAYLMLLTMLTFLRIEEYRQFMGFKQQFVERFEQRAGNSYFKRAKEQYDRMTVSRGGTKKESEAKDASSAKIPMQFFVDRKKGAEDPELTRQYRSLMKRLMMQQYAAEPFFISAVEERPGLLDDLMVKIEESAAQLPMKERIKKPQELANLDLQDPLLNEVLYKMLRGNVTREERRRGVKGGYLSLTDFLSGGKETKIRVYLAPREILLALFEEPDLVEEIVQMRLQIWKQLNGMKEGKNGKEAVSEQFRQFIESRSPMGVNPRMVSYGVSKTDPRKYE